VERTIARRERAVLPFEEGRMLVVPTSVVGFEFRSGKLERVNVFRFAPKADIERHD